MSLDTRALAGIHRRIGPERLDWIAALALLIGFELEVAQNVTGATRWIAAVSCAVIAGAVAFRRRWPAAAPIVAAAASVYPASNLASQGGPAAPIAWALLSYGVGAFLPPARSRPGLVALLLVGSFYAATSTSPAFSMFFDVVGIAIIPWGLGQISRERSARERAQRERAERIDAGREQHALAAALRERTRIAREIHDVIAHSVSVMVIQAAGARTVMDAEPARAERSLHAVERAGREALVEMRRLLGLLGERDERGETEPQPGLCDLEALVSRTCAAGLPTTLRVEGEPSTVAPGLGLCAYRIVQEALTNTIKHAGRARAGVRVRWADDHLYLEIADDGCGRAQENGAGTGHGIAGMRERAALHGGSIQAGPGADRGFTVRARIPLGSESLA